MSSVNKVFILGNLGKDPEIRYTPSGAAVATFSVATSRSWKNSQGEKVEETEWHRMVAYDRLAEVIGEYMRKGSKAHFEGRLKTRKWADKDGNDRYTTETVVEQMAMLGDRSQQADRSDRSDRAERPAPRASGKQSNAFDDMDNDIPF